MAANMMEKKDVKDWTNQDWQNAIRNGYFGGFPDGIIEKAPANVIRDK